PHAEPEGGGGRGEEAEDERQVVGLQGPPVLRAVAEDGVDTPFQDVDRHQGDDPLVGGEGEAAAELEGESRGGGDGRNGGPEDRRFPGPRLQAKTGCGG